LYLILGKSRERCAFSSFSDGHRIQYQNVFENGSVIGRESTVSFTHERLSLRAERAVHEE